MSFRECCHVMSDGMKCKSPALKRQSYCYFHHRYYQRQRRREQLGGPVGSNQNTGIEMPIIETWETIQIGIQEIVEAIVDNRINSKRAGLMLYALQLASANLKMMKCPGISQPTGVTELPEDQPELENPELPERECAPEVATTPLPESPELPVAAAENSAEPDSSPSPAPEIAVPFTHSAPSPDEATPPCEATALPQEPTPEQTSTPPEPSTATSPEANPGPPCAEPAVKPTPVRIPPPIKVDPVEHLRIFYPGVPDENLFRFLPQPNDDATRLYFKDTDGPTARQTIQLRRAMLGIHS